MGGRDKALMLLHGRPLIAHVLARLPLPAGRLAISANGEPGRFATLGLPVLPDHHADKGPLAGVHAGLVWAGSIGAAAMVTASVDCPFLPDNLLERLTVASGPDLRRPAFARAGGRDHPTMALWPVGLLAPLQAHLASDAPPRLLDFLTRAGACAVDFGSDPGFANINTPEDLTAAEARQ